MPLQAAGGIEGAPPAGMKVLFIVAGAQLDEMAECVVFGGADRSCRLSRGLAAPADDLRGGVVAQAGLVAFGIAHA